MREHITLECTQCKNRNYHYLKDKKKKTARLELSKYCKVCRKHVKHREMK